MSAAQCSAAQPALLRRPGPAGSALGSLVPCGQRLGVRWQPGQGGSGRAGGRAKRTTRKLQAMFAGYGGAASRSSSASSVSAPPPNAVKVYEAGRQISGKRIVAETVVQAPVDVVWRVLTSYERLADFVPNLESCERLPSKRAGRVCIRQRGCSQGVLWRLEAEAVLEVEEVQLPLGRREARFSMVEGDFKELNGRWVVEPDPSSAVGMATLLRFDIVVQPKVALPSAIVSYVVRAGLPANIQAVARRAEEIAAAKLRASGLARWAGTEDDPPIPTPSAAAAATARPAWEQEVAEEAAARAAAAAVDQASRGAWQQQQQQQLEVESRDEGLPSKGPFWRLSSSSFAEAAPLTAAQQRRQQARIFSVQQAEEGEQQAGGLGSSMQQQQRQDQSGPQSTYLGVVSVPLPPAGNRDSMQPRTQQELDQLQQQKELLQATYPAFGLRRASARSSSNSSNGTSPAPTNGSSRTAPAAALTAAEVHLRRLDTFDMLHRRAVAAVTINAPPETVWAVLTDYDRLAEFIPNLAVSQRIALPRGAPPNVIRLRQVGYKRMMYMCLHAESVLDLIEKPQSEIQFRQVAGDFERFQGKWMLQGLPPSGSSSSTSGGSSGGSSSSDAELSICGASQTQLKYAVEIVIPRATRMLGVLEPLLERTVFEDVPANLAAIKQRVESLQAEEDICMLEEAGEATAAAALRRKMERPTLAGKDGEMIEDFSVLVAELERCFGDTRVLPNREQLRDMNRTDLEKAIREHGGITMVAQRLGWKLNFKGRRPKGYWDSLENVKFEVEQFIREQGLPPGVMPAKNDFIRAGKHSLARAVERWGGLYELAAELGYSQVSDGKQMGPNEWHEYVSEVAASTGLSGRHGLFEVAGKMYAARRSLQGSMEGSMDGVSEELALAEILAQGSSNGAAEPSGQQAAPSMASSSSSRSSRQGRDGASLPTASKPKNKPSNQQRSRLDRMPSVREEIDAW